MVVATLIDPGHRNRLYEVTGPRPMTFAQCVAEISAVLGRTVKFTSIPVDDYINTLRLQGVPEDLQWLLRELFNVVFDGRNSRVMPGVEEALGRPPTDFKTYVQRTIASGNWTAREQQECAQWPPS